MRGLLDTASDAPPVHRGSGVGDDSFDTNMVVVLAALLSALVCALGLNSIARCVLRCGRRAAAAAASDTAEEAAAAGLKKRALRQMPVAVYGADAVAAVGAAAATECPICLGEYAEGERVRVLPRCGHGFHVKCIDRWLASHSLCPMCRGSLLEEAKTEAAAVVVS